MYVCLCEVKERGKGRRRYLSVGRWWNWGVAAIQLRLSKGAVKEEKCCMCNHQGASFLFLAIKEKQ